MGSPFKMSPGKIGGTARTTGNGFASRGLVNPSALPMHEGKVHTDAKSGNELPSYEVKSSEHSASLGSGSGGKSTYTPPKKTAAGDAAYAALTPEQKKAQDAAYIAKNTKPASNGGSSSVNSSEKKALGKLTLNQVKTDAQNQGDNRSSLQGAKDEREIARQVTDSAKAANNHIQRSINLQGPEIMQGESGDKTRFGAQRMGDRAALDETIKRRNEQRKGSKSSWPYQDGRGRKSSVGSAEKDRIKQSIKDNVSARPKA